MKEQQKFSNFHDLYASGKIPVTAHGTYIGRYPENSLMGVKAAYEAGCDFVEFDVRVTKDGVPVLQHDSTLDRNSDGTGSFYDYTLAELEKVNFSYYEYFIDCSGRKRKTPEYESCPITRLDTVLEEYGKKIFMNIQIYETDPKALEILCGMFKDFDMYGRGYFTLGRFGDGHNVRAIDKNIDLCILERPGETVRTTMALLHDFYDFGSFIAQPRWFDITPQYCEESRKLGIRSNVYYANLAEDAQRFVDCGIDGILTDYPENIFPVVNKIG
ncbi:MAG: hypothetical protein IKB16_12800 [Lentisphaeria bacterium]|nr:hypothetical protein [Lentisphaeria bacterium]